MFFYLTYFSKKYYTFQLKFYFYGWKTQTKKLFEIYKDVNLAVKPKELESRGGAYYSDTACSIISSIYNDKKEIHVVNTVNNGAVSDLPENVVIETNSVIDKSGAHPIVYGKLPIKIRGLIPHLFLRVTK